MDINSLTQPLQFNIVYLDVVTSTNTLARERLQVAKAVEGSVIFANEQTQGRGQLNSVWESNSGKNVLCSLVLTPVFLDSASSDELAMYERSLGLSKPEEVVPTLLYLISDAGETIYGNVVERRLIPRVS